jgi:hypothetical protein
LILVGGILLSFLVLSGGVLLCAYKLLPELIWGSWRRSVQDGAVRDVTEYVRSDNPSMAALKLRRLKMMGETGDVGDYRKVVERMRSEIGEENLPPDAPFDLLHPDQILLGFFSTGRRRLEGEDREIEKERLCLEFARIIRDDSYVADSYRSLLEAAVLSDQAISQEEADGIIARGEALAEELEQER